MRIKYICDTVKPVDKLWSFHKFKDDLSNGKVKESATHDFHTLLTWQMTSLSTTYCSIEIASWQNLLIRLADQQVFKNLSKTISIVYWSSKIDIDRCHFLKSFFMLVTTGSSRNKLQTLAI